jgi:arylsulfatase A-like enzyme
MKPSGVFIKMNTIARFKPTILSLYLGLTAMIATFHMFRSYAGNDWNNKVAFAAAMGDIALLCVLAIVYHLFRRGFSQSRKALVANETLHYIVAFFIALLSTASQLLYINTGETLDINVIIFGLNNFEDLALVLGAGIGSGSMESVALGWGLLALSILKSNRLFLNYSRTFALIFPAIALSSCSIFGTEASTKLSVDVPSRSDAEKSLYQGEYKHYTEKQLEWNSPTISHWQHGIITGFALNATYGQTQFKSLSSRAGSRVIYQKPRYLNKGAKSPNVILVVMESVRHDVIGPYSKDGISQTHTPFLNELSQNSLVYERAYTTIPHTSKALVGIYCGTFPSFNSNISESDLAQPNLTCLPHILGAAGYKSAHFQAAPKTFEHRGTFLKSAGFDHYMTQEDFAGSSWEKLGYLGLDDRALITPSVEWMKKQQALRTPFFASILTIVTHHPYVTPGNSIPIKNTQQAYNQYIAGVRYTDSVIKELFSRLEHEGLLKNTIIIITGDHGEGFAEHGQIAHNGTAHEEGMHVPLIVFAQDIVEMKGSMRGLRQHIDIMPTILDLSGINYLGKLPGINLVSDPHGHEQLITSCFYTDYCLNYYHQDGLKMIYYYGKRSPELYDLNRDAAEKHNQNHILQRSMLEDSLLSAIQLKNSYEQACNSKCF